MKKKIMYWLPTLVMMTLIFIASSLPGNEIPKMNFGDIILKKGGHMIGYALLAFSSFWAAYRTGSPLPRATALSLLLAIAYAASDEYHQSFTPGRSPAVLDVVIDSIGALLAIIVTRVILWRQRAREAA